MEYAKKKAEIELLMEEIEIEEETIEDAKEKQKENQDTLDYLKSKLASEKEYLSFGSIFLKLSTKDAVTILNQENKDMNKFINEAKSRIKQKKKDLKEKISQFSVNNDI